MGSAPRPVDCNDPIAAYTTTFEIPYGNRSPPHCEPPTDAEEGKALNEAKDKFKSVASEYCALGGSQPAQLHAHDNEPDEGERRAPRRGERDDPLRGVQVVHGRSGYRRRNSAATQAKLALRRQPVKMTVKSPLLLCSPGWLLVLRCADLG